MSRAHNEREGTHFTVLVVDDDDVIRMSIADYLRDSASMSWKRRAARQDRPLSRPARQLMLFSAMCKCLRTWMASRSLIGCTQTTPTCQLCSPPE